MSETGALPDYPIVDAHMHIMPWQQIPPATLAMLGGEGVEALKDLVREPSRVIDFMDTRGIERLALINYISPQVFGYTEEVNDFSAQFGRFRPDRFIAFGGIDPRRVPDVAAEMDHLLGDLRLRGIKIHPPHQHFRANAYLNDPDLRGLATVYEKCIAYEVPVMFHTGTSIFPNARSKYGDPIDLDDLIVDFPELKIIIAHGGRPIWMDTAFYLLRRSRNVILDVSSVPPKKLLDYFPWIERVADQAIFGSDWPGPMVTDVTQNVRDFYALPLRPETKRKILRDNALALFPGVR
jgi:predicted TIM-barrel fold metal-dependent hydrolase